MATSTPLDHPGSATRIIEKTDQAAVKPARRIAELDGLRGIAILLVMSFHYVNNQLVNNTSKPARLLFKATSFGWVGVDLFFVLSGFFIGTILIANKGKNNYFGAFYIRRLVKIVPNYYLLLCCFAILCAIPLFKTDRFLTGDNDVPLWSYFAMLHNLFMAHRHTLGNASISVVWSIGIEEQFYLLLPLFVFLIPTRRLPWFLGLVFILAPIARAGYHDWIPPYVLLHCRMDALAAGVLIAYANIHTDLNAVTRKYGKLMAAAMAAVVLIAAFLFWKFNDLGVCRNTLFTLFFSGCVLFALTAKESRYGAMLRARLLVWIGTLSYSLYLFHYMILGVLYRLSGRSEIGIYTIRDLLISLLALGLSFGFAWLVFNVLETPFVALGKKIRYS